MAIYNTPDGRQVVGSVESGNDYHGFNGKRDIIIQLTADGATTDGLNALEYLKAYAIEQNKQNKPIFPNGTRVFISANGYTKAVEADDIVIDGDNITIGGIVWNGSAWDYTNAGQSGGGGLPPVTASDAGKVLTVLSATEKGAVIVPRQYVQITETQKAFDNADASLFTDGAKIIVTVGDSTYEAIIDEGRAEISRIPVITIRKSGNALLYYLDEGNAPENTYISVNLASFSGVWGAGVQEYWIPITLSGSELYIPNDKMLEVANAIGNADRYWVRGAVIDNAYYPGYVSSHFDFIVPLSKSFMRNIFGYDCAGKIHIVEGDPYTVSVEPDRFIVTLTPTAQDYSGTMDKTVAEIDAAYEAGQEIWFDIVVPGTGRIELKCTQVGFAEGYEFPSFNAILINDVNNSFVLLYTGATNDGTWLGYRTTIYTLTPAT